jgi:hypothetical protein
MGTKFHGFVTKTFSWVLNSWIGIFVKSKMLKDINAIQSYSRQTEILLDLIFKDWPIHKNKEKISDPQKIIILQYHAQNTEQNC